MCIICVSPKGVKQPDTKTIRSMFENNPHGAGYMYARDGKVTIHKGFMHIDDLLDQLAYERFTAEDPVVYHFRISTQAGVNPQMTHPFPLSSNIENMRLLDLSCSIGITHNGVIRLTSTGDKKYSDTALFVANYLPYIIRKPADLHDDANIDAIEELIKSKMAILDKTGYIRTIGQFTQENGILFSNGSYKSTSWHVKPVLKNWEMPWYNWA